MKGMRRALSAAAAIAVFSLVQFAAAGEEAKPADVERVDFARDVEPLLRARCFDCHGEDAEEGKLRLDAKARFFQGGVSGRVVVPGQAEKSLLLRRIEGTGDQEQMPLDDEPLADDEIAIIRRWIDAGAVWPEGAGADAAALSRHWAYVPPLAPELPAAKQREWVLSPLDAFVLARLEREGLSPSPPEDKSKLLRRVYLDLVGIPPSPAEIDAFLADQRPGAYERVVERLLASPRYGERWARPWLDLARYADSNGYQADQYRSVWPYRDWVIAAMNADMPFDRFTREQMAGDLLEGSALDQKIATGFHRLTTCNVEAGVDPEENRTNQVIDRVNTTATVWLGSTIECAQCHNHKYDPFTQKDYYQLFAYFNNTPLEVEGNGVQFDFVGPKMDLPLSAEQQAEKAALQRRLTKSQAELEAAVAAREQGLGEWERTLSADQSELPQWHPLEVVEFLSQGGASHEILEDGSVLVGGEKPDTDVYTVVARSAVGGVTGFKLETLTHESLPGQGPGRHHPERPNFVLQEFSVTAGSAGEKGAAAIPLQSAKADYSQPQFAVEGAIDGDPATGWAIHQEFHKPHWASFLTAAPAGEEEGATFTFRLDQHHGQGRTIGRLKLWAMTGRPAEGSLPEDIAGVLAIPAAKRNKKQKEKLRAYYVGLDPQVKRLENDVKDLTERIAAVEPVTTLVMIEQESPRPTAIFKRGNFLDRGEEVTPGTPQALPAEGGLPADRRGLAEWLVSAENPLTARVAVNRWWAQMFGQGIVATEEDFGTQGEPPTHPDLLDWLAVELVESGWSMKHVHRLIVTSNTYRQSSRVTPALLKRDPANLLYARGPRFRLSAESVRDNALAISGLLAGKMGGPPVYPPQPPNIWRHVGRNAPKYDTSSGTDRFRRGIYVVWRRSAPYPSFTSFDAPDRASCVTQRPRTNTPLQALTLLNDPAYVEMATALAERIATDHAQMTPEEKIDYAFRLAVSRPPSEREAAHLLAVFREQAARMEQNPSAAEGLVGKGRGERREVAAWFFIANILLNLDETITKG